MATCVPATKLAGCREWSAGFGEGRPVAATLLEGETDEKISTVSGRFQIAAVAGSVLF